jgi:protease-4
VAGLIARVQVAAAPPGPIQELRAAITAFGAAKPTLAWAETYPGTLSYYPASAFREVWMQPSGTVALVGFATPALFLRQALDKAVSGRSSSPAANTSRGQLLPRTATPTRHREADTASHQPARPVPRRWPRARKLDTAATTRWPTGPRCCATMQWRRAGRPHRLPYEAYADSELAGAEPTADARVRPRLFCRGTHGPSPPTGPALPAAEADHRGGHPARAHRSGRGDRAAAAGQLQRRGDTIAAALRAAVADDEVRDRVAGGLPGRS